VSYTLISIKNIFRYLALMILPMQESSLLDAAGPLVQAVHEVRQFFYPVLMLGIISFSFFGSSSAVGPCGSSLPGPTSSWSRSAAWPRMAAG